MAKYDSVDRLMKMATEKAAKPAAGAERDAEAVLEAKIVAAEPVPAAGHARTIPPSSTNVSTEPLVSPGERGRQLLGALKPFLPAVGSALRMVDHGAVQAVARLLPVISSFTPSAGSSPQPEAAKTMPGLAEAMGASEKRQLALLEEVRAYKARVEALEEQQRRMREGLERTVAEQGSLTHLAHRLTDRSRLLTATVIVLGMMVLAEMVLLGISLHR